MAEEPNRFFFSLKKNNVKGDYSVHGESSPSIFFLWFEELILIPISLSLMEYPMHQYGVFSDIFT